MAKEDDKLIGTKAIAAYLDMSVRNVYHWEKKINTWDFFINILNYQSETKHYL